MLKHVVLKFQGPDCAGCADKIFNLLSSISALRQLRTNPVLLQAEFDLETDTILVSDIIDRVRKVTGYTCEQVTKSWQEIEAIVPEQFGQIIAAALPRGVKDVTFINKRTVSIQYDADEIGARDLLAKAFEVSLVLAPARSHDQASSQLRKTALLTCLSTILTIPILILSWAPIPTHGLLHSAVSSALATVIQVVVVGPLYSSAFRSLIFARTIDMNLMVVLSTTMAYTVSVVSFAHQIRGIHLGMGVYFETSALLVTLIMVGRLVSAYACQRAMKSVSFRSLQPTSTFILDPTSESKSLEVEIDIRLLQYGDVFKVKPDCVIVTDGVVISDLSYVDESMITGESLWIEKKAGSSVVAGSTNRSGDLLVQVSRLPASNTIEDIAAMVDEVTYSKPKVQEMADRFARYFVPAVGIIALSTMFIWILVGCLIRHQNIRAATLTAIPYALSVLVVSCPCAIGLAVPMVMVIASGVSAKRGVVVKSAGALQMARKVSHVVFDKTGTLTESQLTVSVETYTLEPASFTASLILGLTAASRHPVSLTVAKHVGAMGFEAAPVCHVETIVGNGVAGMFNGEPVRIGNSGWVGVEDHEAVKPLLSQGYTVSCVTRGGELLAVFGLVAALREHTSTIISDLQRVGIQISVISGDDTGAVQQAASALNISPANTRSRCSPAEKQKYVKELMTRPNTTVLFCGDGANDAGALAQADVGVYMSSGTEVAQTAADVVLMRPALEEIIQLIDLSRDACRRVCFNFAWSALYNVVAILFAAGAFVNARLPPQYAGLGEVASVVPVVLAGLLLKWRK